MRFLSMSQVFEPKGFYLVKALQIYVEEVLLNPFRRVL